MAVHSPTRFPRKLLAAACIATLLAACGGSGGAGSTTSALNSATTLRGTAIDGYLQGATVFLDLNRNGVQDAGEPSTTTDLNGRYALDHSSVTTPLAGLPVVVTGGVDSDTGFAFAGKLTASADKAGQAQVVTPLTTLVDALVAQNIAPDVAAAKSKVAKALGLTVDQLAADPVAAIASTPAIYAKAVALQRAVLMLASANAQTGEASHESQERVIRALAVAIGSQTTAVDVDQLMALVPLKQSAAAQQLASAVLRSVQTGVNSGGHDGAKAALRALDEMRHRMESDRDYSLEKAADKMDAEHGKTSSRPYYRLAQSSSDEAAVKAISTVAGRSSQTLIQPANTTGRLLASNCFQCHGTGGIGGFDDIRGKKASEIRDYLRKPASQSIMAAHAQGYTPAQIDAIVAYLKQ